MEYLGRDYRNRFRQEDLVHFQVSYRETDLDIGVPIKYYNADLLNKAEILIKGFREDLESYIKRDPVFRKTFEPHPLIPGAPAIALEMAKAAQSAGVGPMAAVAGAFAQFVGENLLPGPGDIIVENGGDIYLRSWRARKIAIFAGESPLSMKIALVIKPSPQGIGICTSSGTVGPSLSFGKADAAVLISHSVALADAAASAVGNVVQDPGDVDKAVQIASHIPGILGAVVIAGDRMVAWGQIELAPL